MTATVTDITRSIIGSNSYGAISTTFGAVAIVLLVVLLAQQELMRASGGTRSRTWIQALNVAILPLLLAFVLIMLMRFAVLLFPGLR